MCVLCVVAVQRDNIWGPFLIISPASTLNNWHQEFTRFVPKFKVSALLVTQSTTKIRHTIIMVR